MPNDAKIEPALTAEEWVFWEARKRYTEADTWANQIGGAAAVAMHNQLLPDGHPLKLTLEDVKKLRLEADELAGDEGWSAADVLYMIAAKIEALLPPESEWPAIKVPAKQMHEVKVMRDADGNPRNP